MIRFVIFLAAAAPLGAHANTGVGYLMLSLPFLALALIPAILVEAPVLARWLKVPFKRGLWLSFVANVASAVLGAIIAIAFDFALMAPTGSSGMPLAWQAILVSLVPMFFITWWIESATVSRMQPAARRPLVRRATLAANAISYALLAIAVPFIVPRDTFLDRSKMTEVVNVLGVAKVKVAEEFQGKRAFPAALKEPRASKYVRRLTLESNGRLVAEVSMPDNKDLDGKHLVTEPRVDGARIVDWLCYSPDIPSKYLPAPCRNNAPAR